MRAFRGRRRRLSAATRLAIIPKNSLIGSLSACHMLWFLHLCADAGIVVNA